MKNEVKKIKSELRKKYLLIRTQISKEATKQKTKKIINKIRSLKEFKKAKNVLLYYPFRNEVNVLPLLKVKNKNFYFPVVDFKNKQLIIRKNNKKFKKNKYGIFEPTENKIYDNSILDLAIIPGLVFDKRCYRIGYGGGYYDKFLKNSNLFTIGVCFREQIIKKIPKTKNDIRLNKVIHD